MKTVLICMVVVVPVAFGAFYYGQRVGSLSGRGEVNGESAHAEEQHEAHQEEIGHESEHGEGFHGKDFHQSPKSEREGKGENHIPLNDDQILALGIATVKAAPGTLQTAFTLPGEIVLNDDVQALVTPYVSGYVKEIRKRQGDRVQKGEVMAVLESRELADAGALYLAARERLVLAKKNFEREESLWRKKITPETDYLESKMALSSAQITVRSARQKLMALGLSKAAVDRLPQKGDDSLTRYEIVSPLEGQVLLKNLSLGEMVESSDAVYRVADMKTVWVKINMLQKQLPYLEKGMTVHIHGDDPLPEGMATLTFIGPLVGRQTRTASGRAILSNASGAWRPGLFVTARVVAGEKPIPLLIPKKAVQQMGGKSVVFVPGGEGFEERVVTTGQSDETHVEITSGLSSGDEIVTDGAFELKATLMTDGMDNHAGHGH
jgi:cobalt-zinc-cadmium efflux system membrane fusion protein